jgi:hypothetical protein
MAAIAAETRFELFPAMPGVALEHRVEATVQNQQLPLASRRVWHADSLGEHFMEVAAARLAASGPEEQEAALTRLCSINPLVRREQVLTGDRKQGNVERVVTFTAPPGGALLMPEMNWLIENPPAKAKDHKTKPL